MFDKVTDKITIPSLPLTVEAYDKVQGGLIFNMVVSAGGLAALAGVKALGFVKEAVQEVDVGEVINNLTE